MTVNKIDGGVGGGVNPLYLQIFRFYLFLFVTHVKWQRRCQLSVPNEDLVKLTAL